MSLVKIESRKPTSTRANNRLRNQGIIPASVVRAGEESLSVQIKRDVFVKKLNELGISGIFDLEIDGKQRVNAMILDIEKRILDDTILSITFQRVSLKEKLKMNVSIGLVNTQTIEHENLIVSMQVNTLPLIALPKDIPDYIAIDATNLKGDDRVFVKDIELPKNTTTDADPDLLVLSIGFPKKAKVEETAVEEEESSEEA